MAYTKILLFFKTSFHYVNYMKKMIFEQINTSIKLLNNLKLVIDTNQYISRVESEKCLSASLLIYT